MPGLVQIQITDNAAEVLRQVKAFPAEMAVAIALALDLENELTVGHAQAKKMSRRGPTTLGVVTNRLRSSLRPAKATVRGGEIESAIGSNVAYAGAHEYGFDGNVAVRGFRRKNARGDQLGTTASEFNPKTGKIRKAKVVQTASGVSFVRPFSRHMRMPARSYIRTSLDERSGDYTSAVSAAVLEAWNKPGSSGGNT